MQKRSWFCLLLLIGTLISCEKNAEVITKTDYLDVFHTITLDSYFDIVLIQGNEHSIKLVGNEKTIDEIEYTIEDSVLTLKNKSNNRWLSPKKNKFKLYLTFEQLKKINAIETCQIQCQDTIQGNELGIFFASKMNEANLKLNYSTIFYYNNHPCGGKLILSGNCSFLKIWNYALMQVDASELYSGHVLIENYSKGDCTIRVSNLLEYSIFGEGNIISYGNPNMIVSYTEQSIGKLILK